MSKLSQFGIQFEKVILSKEWLFMLFLFAINVVWRSILLDFNSIYLDEGQTMFQIMRPVERIVNGYAKQQQNAPLYFILLHYWVKVVGISVFKARLFSAICFSGAAVLFYKFVREHLGFYYALAASALFLLNYDFLNFSHEARGYAMISLLAMASFLVFARLMKKASAKNAVLLGVINLALIYTHYLTIYVFVVQSLSSLLFFNSNRKAFWQYVLSQAGVVLLFAPWLVVVFKVMPEMGDYWIGKSRWPVFQNIFYSICRSRDHTTRAFWVMGIGFATWLATLRKRTAYQNKMLVLLILWGLGVFFMHYFVGKFKPVFIYKYSLYGTLGFLILFVALIKNLPLGRWVRSGILIYAIVWYAIRFQFKTPKMEDWKTAMTYVSEKKKDNNILILQASYTYKCFTAYFNLDFFNDPRNMRKKLNEAGVYPTSTLIGVHKRLAKEQPEEVILMRAHWRTVDKQGEMKAFFDSAYTKVPDSLSIKGIDVHIYRRQTNSSQDAWDSF